MLSDEAIQDFQKILRNSGVNISDSDAKIHAESFLRYFAKIYKPIPKKDINNKLST